MSICSFHYNIKLSFKKARTERDAVGGKRLTLQPSMRRLRNDEKVRAPAAAFQGLADVPPEMEWFANLGTVATRRAYETALKDFMRFAGIVRSEEFRTVTRAHVIAWRDELAHRKLSSTTIRHRLSALASLFDYLCDNNAVNHNPVKGVKRPVLETSEGKTPALGDAQARRLLAAPAGDTLKAKRDRAILATLLYHALRRDELHSAN